MYEDSASKTMMPSFAGRGCDNCDKAFNPATAKVGVCLGHAGAYSLLLHSDSSLTVF